MQYGSSYLNLPQNGSLPRGGGLGWGQGYKFQKTYAFAWFGKRPIKKPPKRRRIFLTIPRLLAQGGGVQPQRFAVPCLDNGGIRLQCQLARGAGSALHRRR